MYTSNTLLNIKADEFYFICQTWGAYVKDKKFYVSQNQEKARYVEHNNYVDDIRYQKFTSPITDAIIDNHSKEELGLDYGCGSGPFISKQLIDKGFQVNLFDPFFNQNKTTSIIDTIIFSAVKFLNISTNPSKK